MNRGKRRHLLSRYSHLQFFAHWTEDDLIRMDRVATDLEFEPGEIISRDIMSGQEFVVLVLGRAVVNGGPQHGLAVEAGDHLGELAIFSDAKAKTVLIAETYSRALLMSGVELRKLMETTPSLGRVLANALAQRLHGVLQPPVPVSLTRPAIASATRTRL